jgi:hypothetical protein
MAWWQYKGFDYVEMALNGAAVQGIGRKSRDGIMCGSMTGGGQWCKDGILYTTQQQEQLHICNGPVTFMMKKKKKGPIGRVEKTIWY